MSNNSSIEISINPSSSFLTNLDIPMNIRPFSLTMQTIRIGIIVVGTLINILVVVVISNSRQLHYPRHMFWAAISINNQLCIIQAVLEIVAIVNHDRVACQIFVFNAGVNYTIVLSFLTLAALDRYLAIARYEWYKKKVTNRGTAYILSFKYIVTYLAATSPFWTGYKNVKNCTINLTHIHVIMIYDLFLGILCVILHVKIFVLSRAVIKKQPLHFRQTSMALQFIPTPSNTTAHEAIIMENEGHLREENQDDATGNPLASQLDRELNDIDCFSWFFNRPKLNRLEIRAAFKMSVNVLPLCLCTFPVTLNALAIYWCIRLQTNCPIVFRINPYLTDLFLIHTIYNPLMYMLTSKEFKRALIHLKEKLKCKNCCQ